jgi:hypothetical protein
MEVYLLMSNSHLLELATLATIVPGRGVFTDVGDQHVQRTIVIVPGQLKPHALEVVKRRNDKINLGTQG